MPRLLHILTRPADPLAESILSQLRESGFAAEDSYDLQVFDIRGPEPDYDELLRAIFEADRIAVW